MQNGDQHYSMEDETYTDIDGKAISLECQSHSGFCREFTVSSAKVSIGRVMAYTCAVWLSAYIIFFVTEVRRLGFSPKWHPNSLYSLNSFDRGTCVTGQQSSSREATGCAGFCSSPTLNTSDSTNCSAGVVWLYRWC
jgi:hypothetical protein